MSGGCYWRGVQVLAVTFFIRVTHSHGRAVTFSPTPFSHKNGIETDTGKSHKTPPFNLTQTMKLLNLALVLALCQAAATSLASESGTNATSIPADVQVFNEYLASIETSDSTRRLVSSASNVCSSNQ